MRAIMNFLVLLSVLFVATHALAAPPIAGEKIVALTLPVPLDEAGKKVLGVEGKTTFSLNDLRSDLIVLEVIGVYCAQCVKQAPGFNDLYSRLSKGKLQGRVFMLALAAGGTEPEVRKITTSGQYLFPVVTDADYSRHKLLGEPLTPYTIVCRPDGTVLYSHLGVIENVDEFYQQIKGFLN